MGPSSLVRENRQNCLLPSPPCHYLLPKAIYPNVMKTTVVTASSFATILLSQTPKVTHPSVMRTTVTAVVLRNRIIDCPLLAISCQAWSTNSWCVSACSGGGGGGWVRGGGGGVMGPSPRRHVIDWQFRGKSLFWKWGINCPNGRFPSCIHCDVTAFPMIMIILLPNY